MDNTSSESEMEDYDLDGGLCLQVKRLPNPTLTYRTTTVGKSLMTTLDGMIGRKKITESLRRKIWSQFDRSILQVFQKIPKNHLAFKAEKLRSFLNLKRNEWIFVLEKVEFREHYALENVAQVKLIVSDGTNPDSNI